MIHLDFCLDWPPSKLVRTVYEWAQRRGAQPVSLWLDAQGWPAQVFLRFAWDRIYRAPSREGSPSCSGSTKPASLCWRLVRGNPNPTKAERGALANF